ncbi:MAG: arginase family protein [Bacteroidales bacterium]|nr:arginase family protein [Bacteroidales bacterium]
MGFETVVMNFSDVYRDFARKTECHYIDCSGISGTECLCDGDAQIEISGLISNLRPSGKIGEVPGLHWLDSGDYHYLSKLWTDAIAVPFTLLLLDHHTDMQQTSYPGLLSCGGWVKTVMETNANLAGVIIVGAGCDSVKGIDLSDERVSVFDEESVSGLSDKELERIFSSVKLNGALYISLDKDVMRLSDAVTNWDCGSMSLAQVESVINSVSLDKRVLGADVCGELSESKGAAIGDLAVNLRTDELLQRFFSGVFRNSCTGDIL